MASTTLEQPAGIASGQRGAAHLIGIVRALAWSEFKLRYAGSVLGYFWSFAKPMMLFGVLYVVFHRMLRLGEGVEHFPEMLLLGIVLWSYFAETTLGCVTVLVQRADMLRKVSFPAVALPIAVVSTAFIVLLFNLATVMGLLLVAGIQISWTWLWFPLLVAELLVLCTGVGLILSSLFVTMRDIGQLWDVGLQLLFYATPIIWPLALVAKYALPGTSIGMDTVVMWSPIAQIIEQSRRALVLDGGVGLGDYLPGAMIAIPYAACLATFALGIWLFRRAATRMVEQL